MSLFNIFCESKIYAQNIFNICELAARKNYAAKTFIKEVLEPAYLRNWQTLPEFTKVLYDRLFRLDESIGSAERTMASSDDIERLYGEIIKATKDSFSKMLEKMNYKVAIDMDAMGEDMKSARKRQMINGLYREILKSVKDFSPKFHVMKPEDKEREIENVGNMKREFESGIMPFINQFLKTNINPKYDSYDIILAKIQGSRELGIRKLGGPAKDALARKIHELLRKEGIEPVYKRKIELLAQAVGAEPPSLEELRTSRRERESRLSGEAEARRISSERESEERRNALSRGNIRHNPDLDNALGIE